MEEAAAIALITLFFAIVLVILVLAVAAIGSCAAFATRTRVRWLGRFGLGIAGMLFAVRVFANMDAEVSRAAELFGFAALAVVAAVGLVLMVRGARRAFVVTSGARQRPSP